MNAHFFVGSLPEAKANCGFLCGQHQMAAHAKKHSRLIGMMTMTMVRVMMMMIDIAIMILMMMPTDTYTIFHFR